MKGKMLPDNIYRSV